MVHCHFIQNQGAWSCDYGHMTDISEFFYICVCTMFIIGCDLHAHVHVHVHVHDLGFIYVHVLCACVHVCVFGEGGVKLKSKVFSKGLSAFLMMK